MSLNRFPSFFSELVETHLSYWRVSGVIEEREREREREPQRFSAGKVNLLGYQEVPEVKYKTVNLLVHREVPEIPVCFIENDNLVPPLWERHLLVGKHLDPVADHINPSANRSHENTNEQ